MIRRLIILLLIVGCDIDKLNRSKDEVADNQTIKLNIYNFSENYPEHFTELDRCDIEVFTISDDSTHWIYFYNYDVGQYSDFVWNNPAIIFIAKESYADTYDLSIYYQNSNSIAWYIANSPDSTNISYSDSYYNFSNQKLYYIGHGMQMPTSQINIDSTKFITLNGSGYLECNYYYTDE